MSNGNLFFLTFKHRYYATLFLYSNVLNSSFLIRTDDYTSFFLVVILISNLLMNELGTNISWHVDLQMKKLLEKKLDESIFGQWLYITGSFFKIKFIIVD